MSLLAQILEQAGAGAPMVEINNHCHPIHGEDTPDRGKGIPSGMRFIDPHNVESPLPDGIPEDEADEWTLEERLEEEGYITFRGFRECGRLLLESRIPIENGKFVYQWYLVRPEPKPGNPDAWTGVRCYPLGLDPKREVYDCDVDLNLKYCYTDDEYPEDFSNVLSDVKINPIVAEQQINETDFIMNTGLVTRFICTGKL